MASTYAPSRPPTERDTIHLLNGCPVYLGCIVSSGGAATSNASTAIPFANVQTSPSSLGGTLAGRVLLLQPSANIYFLPTTTSVIVVTNQTTGAPAGGLIPGVALSAGTTSIVLMRPDQGFLQALGGSAFNLFCWELT